MIAASSNFACGTGSQDSVPSDVYWTFFG